MIENIGYSQHIATLKWRNGNFVGKQNDLITKAEQLSNGIFIEEENNKYYFDGELNNLTNKEKIKKIKIHSNVLEIPNRIFKDCVKLEEISFTKFSKLTKIGEEAFSGCVNLKKITIPKNVTIIGNNAFNGVNNCNMYIKAKTANTLGITNNNNYDNSTLTNKTVKGGIFIISFITKFIIVFNVNSNYNNLHKYEIKKAFDKLDMIIEKYKIETYETVSHKIQVYVSTFTNARNSDGSITLGGASILTIMPSENTYTYGVNFYTNTGKFELNTNALDDMYNNVYHGSKMTQLYIVSLHEISHLLGIGPYWKDGFFQYQNGGSIDFSPPKVKYIEDMKNKEYYTGINALREYKKYFHNLQINNTRINGKKLVGIPIEDNGGDGTHSLHPEEGREIGFSEDNRHINGTFHPGLDRELMTGWAEINEINMEVPLSRITIGFIEDLAFYVNYDESEVYLNL